MKIKYTKGFVKDVERLFSRNLRYRLPRILQSTRLEIKWAFQRAFKYYDDVWCWDTFSRLDYIMPLVMREINKHGYGHPGNLSSEKEWRDIREKIAKGFEAHGIIHNNSLWKGKKYDALNKKYKEGMALFVKHYDSLWD